jgi:hypothetical protein
MLSIKIRTEASYFLVSVWHVFLVRLAVLKVKETLHCYHWLILIEIPWRESDIPPVGVDLGMNVIDYPMADLCVT